MSQHRKTYQDLYGKEGEDNLVTFLHGFLIFILICCAVVVADILMELHRHA